MADNFTNRDCIFSEISHERTKQDIKWGVHNHPPIAWIAILTEEVGEAAKEAVDAHFGDRDIDEKLKNYREELIQVAAVAVAMIECLDRNTKK